MIKIRNYLNKWIYARLILCIIVIAITFISLFSAINRDFVFTVNFSSDNLLVEQWFNISLGDIPDNHSSFKGERHNRFGQLRENTTLVTMTAGQFSSLQELWVDIDGLRPPYEVTLESLEIKKPLTRSVFIGFADIINMDRYIGDMQAEIVGDSVDVVITGIDPHFNLRFDVVRNAVDSVRMRTGVVLVLLAGALVCLVILLIPTSVISKAGKKAASIFSAIWAGLRAMKVQEVALLCGFIFLFVWQYYSVQQYHYIIWPNIPFDLSKIIPAALAIIAFIVIWTKKNKANLPKEFSEHGDTKIKLHYYYLAIFVMAVIAYIPIIFPNPYFECDEFQVIGTAVGWLETGHFVRWNWMEDTPGGPYTRAWPHTLMVSAFFHLFGVSTASGRAVSAILGIIFIVSTFHILSKMTKNRNLAFVVAILLLFSPRITDIFSTIRMYAVMLPVTMWMVYFAYNFLTKSHNFRRDNKVTRFIRKYFDFHFGYLLLTLILVWFNYTNMPNSLTIGLGIVLFIFYKAFATRETKYKVLSTFIIGAIALVVSAVVLSQTVLQDMTLLRPLRRLVGHTDFAGYRFNHEYFWMSIDRPWGIVLGSLLVFAGIYAAWRFRKKSDVLFLASLIYIVNIIFFIFIADRYATNVYMSHIYPFAMLLVVSGVFYFLNSAGKTTKILCAIILSASLIHSTSIWFGDFYVENPNRMKFTTAVEVIRQDAEAAGLDVIPIGGVIARPYYMREAGNVAQVNTPRNRPPSTPTGEVNLILRAMDRLETVRGYVFYENVRWRQSTPNFRYFLTNNTTLLFDEDNVRVFAYHFIHPSRVEYTSTEDNVYDGDLYDDGALYDSYGDYYDITGALSYLISDAQIIDGKQYHHITIRLAYDEYTSVARFLSVRIMEMVRWIPFHHYFQLLIPEDISPGQEVVYEIPIHMLYGEGFIEEVIPLNFYMGNGVFYPEF